jgi:hypothetical protein
MALEPWPLHKGSHGQRTKTSQWLMKGHNVFKINCYRGEVDGIAGNETVAGYKKLRFWLGFEEKYIMPEYGPVIQEYLLGKRKLPLAYRVRRLQRVREAQKTIYWPLAKKGQIIGVPGVGTHSWWAPPNNWQSDNAVDIAVDYGTAVLAFKTGKIGSKVGPLPDPASRFHGIRLYLDTSDGNQFYYAHLSRAVVQPYQVVKAGQVLGYSGVANGVEHLHWASMHGNPLDLLKGLSV